METIQEQIIEQQITASLQAFAFTVIVACGGSLWIAYSEGATKDIRGNIFGIVMIILTLCMAWATLRPFFSIAAKNFRQVRQ